MGSPTSESKRDAELEGQVTVTLTQGFWLGETEVTQAQWQAVLGTSPWEEHKPYRPQDPRSFRAGPDNPASYLLQSQAVAFCAAVDKQQRDAGPVEEGWAFTLPTEAQWEYACRAGTTTIYSFGNNPQGIDTYAWVGLNDFAPPQLRSQQFAHTVKTKQPNPWGLYDMHGNVWEWTADRYHAFTQPGLQGGTDPQGPAVGDRYVCRGGGWYANADHCRSAMRKIDASDWRQPDNGLRLALTRIADRKQ